jgi:hypothetical protein
MTVDSNKQHDIHNIHNIPNIIAAMEGPIVSPYINELIVKTNSTNNENKSKL